MPGLEQSHAFLAVGFHTTCNGPHPHPGVAQRISRGQGRLWGWGVDCSGGLISMP